MKSCNKCQNNKSYDDFYKHSRMKDGYLGACKDCVKKSVRKNRIQNLDYYTQYESKRAMIPKRVEARKIYQSTQRGKSAMARSKNKWTENNKKKRIAINALNNAVRDGRIVKIYSCECCGVKNKRIHGHHCDYNFPLVVMWLCPKCHRDWHQKNGEGKNPN